MRMNEKAGAGAAAEDSLMAARDAAAVEARKWRRLSMVVA
jgi:hypothetical protein